MGGRRDDAAYNDLGLDARHGRQLVLRALVTGGGGFIGHHLVRGLLDRGDEVRVLDDFSTGDRARLAGLSDRIELVEGSILDTDALDTAAAGCEVIFHEAAIPSVPRLSSPHCTPTK